MPMLVGNKNLLCTLNAVQMAQTIVKIKKIVMSFVQFYYWPVNTFSFLFLKFTRRKTDDDGMPDLPMLKSRKNVIINAKNNKVGNF